MTEQSSMTLTTKYQIWSKLYIGWWLWSRWVRLQRPYGRSWLHRHAVLYPLRGFYSWPRRRFAFWFQKWQTWTTPGTAWRKRNVLWVGKWRWSEIRKLPLPIPFGPFCWWEHISIRSVREQVSSKQHGAGWLHSYYCISFMRQVRLPLQI